MVQAENIVFQARYFTKREKVSNFRSLSSASARKSLKKFLKSSFQPYEKNIKNILWHWKVRTKTLNSSFRFVHLSARNMCSNGKYGQKLKNLSNLDSKTSYGLKPEKVVRNLYSSGKNSKNPEKIVENYIQVFGQGNTIETSSNSLENCSTF